MIEDLTAQVEFLRTVFGGTGTIEPGRPAEICMGDSLVIIYRNALEAGATSIEDPIFTPYGDRRAMFRDPFGNVFQVAHELA